MDFEWTNDGTWWGFPLPSLTTSKIAHPKIVLGKLTPKSLIDLGVSQAMVISKCSLDLPCLNAGQCIGACQYVFVQQNQRCWTLSLWLKHVATCGKAAVVSFMIVLHNLHQFLNHPFNSDMTESCDVGMQAHQQTNKPEGCRQHATISYHLRILLVCLGWFTLGVRNVGNMISSSSWWSRCTVVPP